MTAALITYEHLHTLRAGAPPMLLARFADCMARFGYAAEPAQALAALDMRDDQAPELAAACDALAALYGAHPRKLRGTDVSRGTELRTFLWPVPRADPGSAWSRIAALQPLGELVRSRVSLKLIWDFRFRDPDTRELLDGQDDLPQLQPWPGGAGNSSSIVLNLGAPSTCALRFLLPFADPGPAFQAYVGRLEEALPLRFARGGWRRWQRTRTGTWKAQRMAWPPASAAGGGAPSRTPPPGGP